MKQNLLYFILGVLTIVFLSATPIADFITVTPATPKYTVVYNGENPQTFTSKYAKQGYVVVSSASQGYYNTYVVMAKY